MKRAFFIASVIVLAGCVYQAKGEFHEISSGKRVDADSETLAKFQQAKVICDGEAAQAASVSTERDRYVHTLNITLVFDGCLAKRGYIRK